MGHSRQGFLAPKFNALARAAGAARRARQTVVPLITGGPGGKARGRRAWILLVAGAALFALALVAAAPPAAAAVPSIVVEDGSTVYYNDTEVVVDGSLSGPHAGDVFIANGSTVRLTNTTLRFVNTTEGAGVILLGASTLSLDASTLSAASGSGMTIQLLGGSRLTADHANLSTLQGPADLSIPGISLGPGSSLLANESRLVARPDLRPLVVASQGTVDIMGSTLGGRMSFSVSTVHFARVTLTSFGEAAAISSTGSAVVLEDSTVTANAGGSAAEALGGSDFTVRSTNLTAQDIGITLRGTSLATLESVAIVADAFGIATEDSVVTGANVALVGAQTSVWSRNSDVTLTAPHLGSGILRLFNGSDVSIDGPTTAVGYLILEDNSHLTLTDASFDWAKLSVTRDSAVVPRWRPLFEFHTAAGGNPGAGVSWAVRSAGGSSVGSGTSNSNGASRGPPLEGPRLVDGQFASAPRYTMTFTDGNVSVNTTVSAWGPGLVFPLYLAPSLPDLDFSAAGLMLSEPAGGPAGKVNASARLSVPTAASGREVEFELTIDGRVESQFVRRLTGPFDQVTFLFDASSGTHLIAIRADLNGSGARGAVQETNERGNNEVALWYNATSNTSVPIKPDLVITSVTYEFVHTTALDPVTGESVDAAQMVVFVEILNRGLTDAGPFDVGVAAGVNTTRTTIPGAVALGNVTAIVEFGPYLRPDDIVVLAEADIDREVDESDEVNNALTVPVHIDVTAPDRPGPAPLALLLALGAAGAVVALAAWGGWALWRPDRDEDNAVGAGDEAPEPAGPAEPAVTTEPAAPAPPPPAAAPPAGPPAPPAAPPAQPPAPPMPGPYGPAPPWGPVPAFAPAPGPVPPAYYPAFAPPSAQGPAPPAKCPRCGSSQVSYTLYPVRQVVCASCHGATLF